jgi:hypothetical protein
MTHAISELARPGDSITYTAGRVTITLQFVRDDAYAVTVYQGTLRIEDNCGSYSTEAIARSVARLYAELARAEAQPVEPASLAVLAAAGTARQVAPTMAGAHLADTTDPQHRALATAAVLGRVERGGLPGQEGVRTLKALARKGFARLVMRPGKRYDVDHAVLLPAGVRELERLDAEADRRNRTLRNLNRFAA